MTTQTIDILVIGGGCSGMAAALAAYEQGAKNILILERSECLGGVLRQCIHNGFGVHRFKEDLTGVEYAHRFIEQIHKNHIPYLTNTVVLSISKEKEVIAVNRSGLTKFHCNSIILATGCRERSRGALLIPGSRPAGILSAGTAQRYLNLEGYLAGKKIVILGSGDIGLIMSRQFVMEGAEVLAIAEIMPYSSGLSRNIVQCVEDFDIPLYFETTVSKIEGRDRLEAVWLSRVDAARRPIPGTERRIECDTLILSVGLIPENELAVEAALSMDTNTGGPIVNDLFETSVAGIFACGNSLHVHDLADFVSIESESAGRAAAMYIKAESPSTTAIPVHAGQGVRALVPQEVHPGSGEKKRLQFRPDRPYKNAMIRVSDQNGVLTEQKKFFMTPAEMCEVRTTVADTSTGIKVEVIHP